MGNKIFDTIIIGGGAAGLTAAMYTCRKNLNTLLIGQTNLTNHIENYPGYTELSGPNLMQIFLDQAVKFGTEVVYGKTEKIEKNGKNFRIKLSNDEEYEGRTLILAYGKVPRELGIPGEKKFIGRGVSTCATCDAPLFKNKTVAIVGGGNSALEAALLSSEFSTKVYLVHRRDAFRGDPITVDKLKKKENIEFMLGHAPVEIKGDKFVAGLVVEDVNTKEKREIPANGIFVEIGYIINVEIIKHLVKLNDQDEIIINDLCETSAPGVFAAGDLTIVPYKQTVISAGEGAKAGMTTYNYLQELEGKPKAKIDWS